MTERFEHGYAVVIGVDANQIRELALPPVAGDVRAIHEVLTHPERCAFPAENVRFLSGAEATKANILAALTWLRDTAAADPQATAILYYSGHGATEKGQYFLIPYDVQYGSILTAAIKAEEFNDLIRNNPAKRLLVMLDCCHAGGIGSEEAGLESLETAAEELPIAPEAFPIDLTAGDIPEYTGEPGDDVFGGLESLSDLLDGEGRAVLNSSTGAQKSYLRNDRTMSLFTYHLIEALTGHAPHPNDATVVYVTDVMSWVTREVKRSAAREGRDQTPMMRTSGVFPVAQLLGGRGLGADKAAPDPLATLPPTIDLGDLAVFFAPLHALAASQTPDLTEPVNELQSLAAQGTSADDLRMATLILDIADALPAAKTELAALFLRLGLATAGPITRFAVGRLPK